jgi:transcriptional regulator with XRE-family HTH domain
MSGSMKADRDSFGPRLKLERERRGITLKDIAESTKIKESLFAELERSDFSKWPQGIFRRAHLCDYISAIGLPTQPILAEYLRLFPEESPVDQSEDPQSTDAIGKPQAGQGVKPAPPAPPLADRAWILCFDLAAVCLISSIVAGTVGMSLWPAVALVGLGYSAAGSVCFAQSAGAYVQHWIHGTVEDRSASQGTSETPVPEVRLIASRRQRGSSPDRSTTRELEVHSRRASA